MKERKGLHKNRFKARLFGFAVSLASRLAGLPNKLTPPAFRLLQIESAYWQSRALYIATKLGLADALAEGERTASVLAGELSLHEDNLYRLMRMLASIGVFEEVRPRTFRNNRLSEPMRSGSANSVRDMILMHNCDAMSRPWMESLEAGIREGEVPFVVSHGEDLFGYMDSHPDFDHLFSRAMDEVESLTGLDYLQDFDWSGFDRLIDVGGSKGAKAMAILKQNPGLAAVVFDRQQVIETAEEFWRSRGQGALLERVEFVGGDMFDSIPPARSSKDLYLCMALFHGLDDEQAGRVLKNIRESIAEQQSTLLVVDAVAEEVAIDPNVAAMDMQMLVNSHGRERTASEWKALFQHNDFSLQDIIQVRTFARFILVAPI